jgi:undecaprenyl-diphosphatase
VEIIGRIEAIDRGLFLVVNNGWCSPAADVLMVFLSSFGNGFFLAAVAGGALFFFDREHFGRRFVVIAIAVGAGALINEVIKEIVARPRPLAEFADGIRSGTVWVHTVFERHSRNSFPSGHAQAAFGTAAALAYYYRRWYVVVPVFALACGVAVSRVCLGVHFPLDVAAGAVLGIACSLVTCAAWERARTRHTTRLGAARRVRAARGGPSD